MLTDAQIAQFHRDGYLVVPDAVTDDQLERLRADVAGWVQESRSHREPYGAGLDGRPRFDVEPGHSPEAPALRRVAAPSDVSEAFREVATRSAMVDAVADLIGPNVKLHHTKVNTKLPGAATAVKWHQDFPFTPHTNSDLVTALLMVDDVTDDNGPLEVVPGSQSGPIRSLWHDGEFTGALDPALEPELSNAAVRVTGPAGAACLMHTRLVHGSAPNRSDRSRTLFISVYAAGDAHPCAPSPVPTADQGRYVHGADPETIRVEPYELRAPEHPSGASFFTQQQAHDSTGRHERNS